MFLGIPNGTISMSKYDSILANIQIILDGEKRYLSQCCTQFDQRKYLNFICVRNNGLNEKKLGQPEMLYAKQRRREEIEGKNGTSLMSHVIKITTAIEKKTEVSVAIAAESSEQKIAK